VLTLSASDDEDIDAGVIVCGRLFELPSLRCWFWHLATRS